MTKRLTADEVNSMDSDIYLAARLAYRLGRQDQQRILEHRLRKHFDSDVQARTLADLAEGMTDDLVDFHAIIRAAEKDSTPVNSPEPGSAVDWGVHVDLTQDDIDEALESLRRDR